MAVSRGCGCVQDEPGVLHSLDDEVVDQQFQPGANVNGVRPRGRLRGESI